MQSVIGDDVKSSSPANHISIIEEDILAVLGGNGAGALADVTAYRRTDVGNANLFIALHGVNIRYVEEWLTWLVWDGNKWCETSDNAMTPLAVEVTEYIFTFAATLPEKERDTLIKHATASQRRERLMAMINLAKGDSSIRSTPEQFDANKWLIGCGSFTCDLHSGKLYPSIREDFITKSTAVTPDMNGSCTSWIAFLEWVFGGDKATIEHVQRIFGYALTGDVSEEKLFTFFGCGANGKTTAAMTMVSILGDYAGKARSDLLTQFQGERGSASPDIAALHGKRLVIVSETDENCSLAEAQVKSVTSNEPITARRLHRDPFTFMPTHKILMMTNHRPFVKGTDDGIWRRLNIIAFKAQMAEEDKNPRFREEQLLPELGAILAWAIQGCAKWLEDGLKPSSNVKNALNAYRGEMDFISDWLSERTELDELATISRSRAYQDYRNWGQGIGAPILGNRRFVEELGRRGFSMTATRGVRGYKGFKLKNLFEITPITQHPNCGNEVSDPGDFSEAA